MCALANNLPMLCTELAPVAQGIMTSQYNCATPYSVNRDNAT